MNLAPDTAIRHRDTLLSPRSMRRVLSRRLGGLAIERCDLAHVKYRRRESVRVVYRVTEGGRLHHLAGRSVGGDQAAPTCAATDTVPPHGPLPAVVPLPELGAVLWTFPNDRKLANLRLLAPPLDELGGLLGRRCAATRLVAYAAERAATAECLDGAGRVVAYVKLHDHEDGEPARRAHELVAGQLPLPRLRVPRLLAWSAPHATMLLEPAAGRRLDAAAPAALPDAFARLGAAVAELHELAPNGAPRFERLDARRLETAAAVVGDARPDARIAAEALLERLVVAPQPHDEPDVCLHGDLNTRNALLDGDRLTLIDLEHVSAGPAAADLGQLLASLLCSRVVRARTPHSERALADALLRGYAAARALPDADSLRWHAAASVLARCALPAVNRVRPPVLARLQPLLVEARELVR